VHFARTAGGSGGDRKLLMAETLAA